jgi:hypothetical protein
MASLTSQGANTRLRIKQIAAMQTAETFTISSWVFTLKQTAIEAIAKVVNEGASII